MTADIDPAFATRCEATAIGLRQLAELGARPDADEGLAELAARVTAELLTDPEALLAVALTLVQQGIADSQPIRVLEVSVGAPEVHSYTVPRR